MKRERGSEVDRDGGAHGVSYLVMERFWENGGDSSVCVCVPTQKMEEVGCAQNIQLRFLSSSLL